MRSSRRWSSVLILTLLMSGVWYLLSGKFDILHFGTGVVTAFVIAMNVLPARDGTGVRPLRLLAYIPWLVWQIVLSNLRVARLVLSPGLPISPALVVREPGVIGARALTALGCSVTLTPGTLTIDVGEDEIFVHALDAVSAQDVREGVIARRLAAIFSVDTGR